MVEKINVTPEKLKTTAASLQETGAGIRRTTADMMQPITGISTTIWSGDACSSFLGKFKGLEADINKMYQMIEEEAQNLITISKEYQSAEEQNKAASAALKNNVIL